MNYYAMFCVLAATMLGDNLETGAANIPNLKSIHYSLDFHYIKQKNKTDSRSIPFSRQTLLYSKASSLHLQVINGTVNGLGKEQSAFAKLKILSDTFGRVKIMGAKSKRYLCMNKKGRLVGRTKTTSGREKKKKCIFKERETSSGYRLYESVKYPKWFIAVNQKGRVVPGPLTAKRKARKHRQFLPGDYSSTARPRKRYYRGRARGFSRRQRMKRQKRRQRFALRRRKP